ncbi:MAG: aminotransferase class I/II-fold pyridoxal phosphate-dependent enzyme [Bradymonadia bacterium]
MTTLDDFAQEKLHRLSAAQLRRRITPTARGPGLEALRDGHNLVSFCDNDYLGLSHDPRVKAAAVEAIERSGAGAGASRLITGDNPLYCALERRLAHLKGTADALVFGSGYLANTGVIPALMGPDDLIVIDALSHACLFAGARLARSRCEIFAHNDVDAAAAIMQAHRAQTRRCMLITEGVFSMDGDLAPLSALAALARRWDAWLLTDDAHGLGVIGNGRGSAAAAGLTTEDVPLQMGTLSKAVGSYGGYLCASAPVIDLLRTRGRTLVYSTGLPPATLAASEMALRIIHDEADTLCGRPVMLAQRFAAALALPTPETPIVPLIMGSPTRALAGADHLLAEGYLVSAIRAPTVPVGTERLRLTFSAAHTEAQVDGLIEAVRPLLTP